MEHDHDDGMVFVTTFIILLLTVPPIVYNEGPHYFKGSIFAFVTLSSGKLTIQGRRTIYRDPVPDGIRKQFPTIISDRKLLL